MNPQYLNGASIMAHVVLVLAVCCAAASAAVLVYVIVKGVL
jgi:hypothetical protein